MPVRVEGPEARVTVVVPSFRQGRFLERTLGSIVHQQGVAVDLVVVDAVSDDETPEVLDAWRDRITQLVVEPDDGQADAIAKGMARSDAAFVTWLNADDAYAGPDALATLVGWLERRPDIDLVYGRRTSIDAEGRYHHRRPWRPFDADALRVACYLPQECAVFRRAAYDAVGGIDPSFAFALDYDLWVRMLDAGSRFLSVPELVGLFRTHPEQKTSAAWVEVGLVEIARIHERSGPAVPEDLMIAVAEAHDLGFRVGGPAAEERLCRDVNAAMNGYRALLFGGRPLDRWWDSGPQVGAGRRQSPT